MTTAAIQGSASGTPFPVNEQQRIETLLRCRILDTLPEQFFDDLAELAAYICATPIAAISLVDRERQWFKARVGIEATETPRDLAFCAHAIMRPHELMIVADARKDARFEANPLVLGAPEIRFYAGAPLLMRNGMAVGVLCVIDTVPRELSAQQTAALNALSRSVVSELELRISDYLALERAEAALQASEARYCLLFQTMNQGVVYQAADGRIIEVNQAAERALGLSLAQLQGRTSTDPRWRALREDGTEFPGDEHPAMQALRTGHAVNNVVMGIYNPSDNSHRWLAISAIPLFRAGEAAPTEVYATFEDITERRQAEQALRTSEEKYRRLMESLDSAILIMDGAGHCQYMNDIAVTWLGLQGKATHEVSLQQLFAASEAAQRLETIQRVISTNQGHVTEVPIVLHGQARWYHVSLSPLYDEQAHATYVLINATDIHALKTTQHELLGLTSSLEERVRVRTAEVQDLYDNAPTGYQSLDGDGMIISINRTQLDWLGYRLEELVGQPFATIISARSREPFRLSYAEFKQRGWLREAEYDLLRKDGTSFPVSLSATALYDEAGFFVMSRCSVLDNTERKQAEAAQQIAHAEIARALRTKDEFLANMSHELRTPLNAILGLSESLLEGVRGPLSARQQESLSQIQASGQHLLSLINDILDLSKIEAERLELLYEAVPVAELCQACLRLVREQALKKQLRLSFKLNDELAELQADPKRLKQMLLNLLSNAVKFTAPGGMVALEVLIHPQAGVVRFSVCDTGIGISTEDQTRLFKPFTQLDARLNRQHEGTGLGLALVQRLAQLHGGTVSVGSELGVGSCFTITLPYAPN